MVIRVRKHREKSSNLHCLLDSSVSPIGDFSHVKMLSFQTLDSMHVT